MPASSNQSDLLYVSLTNLNTNQQVNALTRDGNYRLKINFITNNTRATRVTMRLNLLIGQSEIRLPFFRKKNFCLYPSSKLTCPLRSDNPFNTFQLDVHIPTQTPNINGTLQLKLLNENREKLLCILFPLIVE